MKKMMNNEVACVRGKLNTLAGKVVKAAAGSEESGKGVMTLLLSQPGIRIQITEEMVKAAVGNEESGREGMTLLLN